MSSHTVETQTQTQATHPMASYQQPQQYQMYHQAQPHQQQMQQQYQSAGAMRQLPSAQSSAAGVNAAGKVLAERYKTKVCKNYIEMGMCPYESRCMFAHGDEELRTTEMNLHDGIVTEDSIRHYKRMQAYKVQAQQAAVLATEGGVPHHHSQGPVGAMAHQGPPSYECSSFASTGSALRHHSGSGLYTHDADSESSPMTRKNSSHCMSFTTAGDQYCYDPYGWTPYHNGANPQCECADCLYNAEVEYSSSMVPAHHQHRATTDEEEQDHDEVDAQQEYIGNVHDVAPMPYKSPAASHAQTDVAGHALRRPMMP